MNDGLPDHNHTEQQEYEEMKRLEEQDENK